MKNNKSPIWQTCKPANFGIITFGQKGTISVRVGQNETTIKKYIQKQEKADIM